jgi:TP901 family phage tail tape measure protein
MPDLEKNVSIIFSGVDKTGAVFSGITKNLDQFSGKIGDVTQPLADVAGGVLKTEGALAALAAGGLALAVNESGKFSDSFNEITTLIDDTGQGVDKFRGDILDYARDSKKSIEDINSSLYAAKSAGVEYTYTLETLNDAEKLSIAGKADLESSTKTLASSLNAYGESTSEATRYSDILFKTVKLGQTTLPELSTSLSSVTNIASSAGIPFETLAAAIAAVTATGMPTSQAITSIKAAISSIIKPSSEAQKEADRLGIKFDAAALKSEGFEKILWKVHEATGGSADKMALLFGSVEALPTAMALGSDTTGRFKDDLEEMANAAGATEVAYGKMVDNFGLKNQNLANNVKVTLIQVGDHLTERYAGIVDEVSNVFKAIGSGIDANAFDPIFDLLDQMGLGLEELFAGIAKAMPEALDTIDWEGFTSSIKGVVDEVGDLFGAMFGDVDLTTPEGLAEAMQKVIDAGTALNNIVKGLLNAWEPFIRSLSEGIDKFSQGGADVQEFVGKILGLGQAINKIAGLVGPLASSLTGLTNIFIGLAGIKAGKTLLSFSGNATTTLASIKGLPAALNAVTGSAAGKTGMLGLAAAAGWASGTIINENVPAVGKVAQSIFEWSDKLLNWTGTQKNANQVLIENKRFLEAQAQALSRATHSLVDLEEEIDGSSLLIKPVVDLEDFENDLMNQDWGGFNIAPIPIPVETDFDAIQSDWDAMTDEMEGADIKMPVKADSKSIEDTKKKIKSSFTKASMGDINLPFDFSGSGVGNIGDGIKSALDDMEPIDIGEVVDMSGLADLMDSIAGLENYADRQKMTDEALNIARAQREVLQAETRNLNARNAILQQETQNITRMESGFDNTIKIEAAGLEPEMEAFMWKLLKKIQARANASGAEFLLAASGA